MTKMQALAQLGQSIWLDYIRRSLLDSGELEEFIGRGLRGMTSNPSIFSKAIGGSSDYDTQLRSLSHSGGVMQAYEALAIADIQDAADCFRPLYDGTNGADGFVSLEVDPRLADQTEATIAEALHLWTSVNRPNVMIKVPATKAGLPAIRALIGSGVNINVTLMFSQSHYDDVVEAYIAGLEDLAESGTDLSRVASVASVFISRVDTAVDKQLEDMGRQDLQGKTAIANAKVIYASFQRLFSGARWAKLEALGARPQRPLWGSTGTKNPDYSDTLYIDQLIGPMTVNTVPPDTLAAFEDHGTVALTLTKGLDEARGQLAELARLGIDLEQVGEELQRAGVKQFADAFEELLQAVTQKLSA